MLRLSLIIAIIAGLAAAALNVVKVKKVITDTMKELADTKQTLATREGELATKTKELEKTTTELTETKTDRDKTKKELQTMTAKYTEAAKQVEGLTSDFNAAKIARDEAQQKLEQWRILNVSPEQVKGMIVDLDKTKKDLEITQAEKQVFVKKATQLQAKLDDLLNPDRAVPLPPGLKGTVVAVDPKFDFVVINVGKDKGVLERGEMLVNRNGKLVGKIRIAAVQPKQSVANIIPEWKRDEIMEGDQVLY